AKNPLQECAIDLLMDTSIPIKIIAGTYGSGKTILSVKTAIHNVLSKGNYSKIMMVRNPIGSGKEIGFLKGTKDEKTECFFKPFIQHLDGGEQEAWALEQRGVLLREIPYFMKGLSIDETLVLCDEAEDLDAKLIKLIGTRLGDDSAVVFSGDYNQAENEYLNNNGLLLAIEKLKGNPLVGVVILDEDVRSAASKVFAEL
ncbi:PhoH family protein, partial [Paenibacillus pini]